MLTQANTHTPNNFEYTVNGNVLMSSFVEEMKENENIFNSSSGGAIQIGSSFYRVDPQVTAFWDMKQDTVYERDPESMADRDPVVFDQKTMSDVVSKLGFGPVVFTLDSLKKQNFQSDEEFSAWVGRKFASDFIKRRVKIAVAVLRACSHAAGLVIDKVAEPRFDKMHLINARRQLGATQTQFTHALLHNDTYFDHVEAQNVEVDVNLNNLFFSQASQIFYGMTPMVVNSDELIAVDGVNPDAYTVLQLAAGAMSMDLIDFDPPKSSWQLLKDNMSLVVQGQGSLAIGADGFEFNTATGGKHPGLSALATSSNWIPKKSAPSDYAFVGVDVKKAA